MIRGRNRTFSGCGSVKGSVLFYSGASVWLRPAPSLVRYQYQRGWHY